MTLKSSRDLGSSLWGVGEGAVASSQVVQGGDQVTLFPPSEGIPESRLRRGGALTPFFALREAACPEPAQPGAVADSVEFPFLVQ